MRKGEKADQQQDTGEAPQQEVQKQNIKSGVMEVPIDLTLINNKCNYIISKLEEISQRIK